MKQITTSLCLVLLSFMSLAQSHSAGKAYYVNYETWNASESKPNTHINCGNNAILNTGNELSIEAWIRPRRGVEDQKLIGKALLPESASTPDNGYVMGIQIGSIYSEIWNPTRNSVPMGGPGSMPIDSAWIHISTTFKAGHKLINYVNGELYSEVEVELNNPIGSNDGDLIIGLAPWDALSLMYFGEIDEVKIWNKALSPDEIKAHMHIPSPASEHLVAYYNFDNATDTVVEDISGNNNTGKVRVADNDFWSWSDSYAPIGSKEMAQMQDIDASWSYKNSDQWQAFTSGGVQGNTDIEKKAFRKYLVVGHNTKTGVENTHKPNTNDPNYKYAQRAFLFNKGGDVTAPKLYFNLNDLGLSASDMPTNSALNLYTLLWRKDSLSDYLPLYHPTGSNSGFLIFNNIPLKSGYYTIGHGDVELVSVEERESFGKNINLYPNPCQSKVNITHTLGKKIEVIDLTGHILFSLNSTQNTENIPLDAFKSGIYFVRISKGNLSTYKKLILNK